MGDLSDGLGEAMTSLREDVANAMDEPSLQVLPRPPGTRYRQMASLSIASHFATSARDLQTISKLHSHVFNFIDGSSAIMPYPRAFVEAARAFDSARWRASERDGVVASLRTVQRCMGAYMAKLTRRAPSLARSLPSLARFLSTSLSVRSLPSAIPRTRPAWPARSLLRSLPPHHTHTHATRTHTAACELAVERDG